MYLRAHSAIPRAVNALLQNVAQNDDVCEMRPISI